MKNIVITAADNMSDETYRYICDGFTKKFGEECSFQRITNNSIIGGFIADADGRIFDLSIASQLKEIKKHIAG